MAKQISPAAMRRWEAMYDDMQAKLRRQQEGLTRLLAVNTELTAALMEIVDSTEDADVLKVRARHALDRCTEIGTSGNSG